MILGWKALAVVVAGPLVLLKLLLILAIFKTVQSWETLPLLFGLGGFVSLYLFVGVLLVILSKKS